MVEKLLNRVQEEMKAGNTDPAVQTTTKMYTMVCSLSLISILKLSDINRN